MSMSRTLKTCTALAALLIATATASATVSVDFVPGSATTTVGGTASYDLVATISDPVLGWGLDLVIGDPLIGSLVNVSVDPAWTAGSADGDGLGGVSFPAGLSGVVTLATITLQGNAIGTTALDLAITAGDLTEGFALDPVGFDADVTLGSGVLNVVPEPASLSLLALAGLLIRRR
jgi:hypothetical protein